MLDKNNFESDILEFLILLYRYDVQYLIVGGEAAIYYGNARLTGDIDIFYCNEAQNVDKLYAMLNEFWNYSIPSISNRDELLKKGMVFQFGVPPNRVDLINSIEGVFFNEAWNKRVIEEINIRDTKINLFYISLEDLIKNKQMVNRPKDVEDLKFLLKAKSIKN